MGRLNKGLFIGGLLGAGMTWLFATKKGKEVREQMLDYAADVYTTLRQEVMKTETYDKLTKQKYVVLVQKFVDKYAVDNGLAKEVKDMVVKVVTSQWDNIRKELKNKK